MPIEDVARPDTVLEAAEKVLVTGSQRRFEMVIGDVEYLRMSARVLVVNGKEEK